MQIFSNGNFFQKTNYLNNLHVNKLKMADYTVLPFVEIEIRLGTQNKNYFDSSVDKRYFEKINGMLSSGDWKMIDYSDTTEYIKDSTKLILPTNKVIFKENVFTKTHTLSNLPFDIRFSVNQEFKMDSLFTNISKNDSLIRNKKRTSYISDNFKYDLTIVNETKNGINNLKHEIEIELLITSETLKWASEYINDFLECKIYDLVNIVEPINRDTFKIKLF